MSEFWRTDADIASTILQARAERRCLVAPLEGVGIRDDQAYSVQALMTQARLSRGERIVGWKLGYTSAVMREQMGITTPNFGPLTDAMLLADGDAIPGTGIQPRVEPEIALILATDLGGDVDREDVSAAVHGAVAALEVVDSVWCDYRFSWAENTADGSSAAFVVLGPTLTVMRLDELAVTMTRNGEDVGRGTGAAAMGDPLMAVAWLCGQLAAHDRVLRAGDIVMTGGITAAVPLRAGDTVTADFAGVRVTVAG